MKSLSVITIGALIVGLTVLGCSQQMSGQGDAGWVTLLDGSNPKTLDNWNRIGDANWRAEFWADHTTNSGIFIRIADPNNIARNSYEVNIYDQRPEPEYGTRAIVNVAKVSPM